MTREERAIQILEQRECCRECVVENCTCAECDEAFDMAIQALQAQADGDYISRQDAIEFFKDDVYVANELKNMATVAIPQTDCNTCDKAVRDRVGVIGCAKFDSKPTVDIPSAELCEDAISRQAVMDCFKKWQPYMATRLWDFEQELSKLPLVNPQPICEEREKGECPYYAG